VIVTRRGSDRLHVDEKSKRQTTWTKQKYLDDSNYIMMNDEYHIMIDNRFIFMINYDSSEPFWWVLATLTH
jgi:hypothetical protein